MVNFTNTTFSRIIFHQIFQKKSSEEYSNLEYQNSLIGIDSDVEEIIKNRLTDACGKRSRAFKLHIENISPGRFFPLANDLRNVNDEEFVEKSKDIALELAKAQRRTRIPGGYLILIDAIDSEGDGIVIVIKAEPHEAVKSTYDSASQSPIIELIKDIFLSPA